MLYCALLLSHDLYIILDKCCRHITTWHSTASAQSKIFKTVDLLCPNHNRIYITNYFSTNCTNSTLSFTYCAVMPRTRSSNIASKRSPRKKKVPARFIGTSIDTNQHATSDPSTSNKQKHPQAIPTTSGTDTSENNDSTLSSIFTRLQNVEAELLAAKAAAAKQSHNHDNNNTDDSDSCDDTPPIMNTQNKRKTKSKKQKSKAQPSAPPTPSFGNSDTSSESDSDLQDQPPVKKKRVSDNMKGEETINFSDSDSDYDTYDRPTPSFGNIIGSTVNNKLKHKILTDRYIDMSELLPQYRVKSADELIMKVGKHNTTTLLKNKTKYNITFQQWSEAFDVYMAVYIEKAQSRSDLTKLIRAMLTYKKEIFKLKNLNYNWAAYDQHFRLDREASPFP